ncbi:MAG: DUF1015 domain-containing protein [Elusimicrobia bacterium]|nr:DUF1015 domain-containing protein [Elusimicrobiota bacterium]
MRPSVIQPFAALRYAAGDISKEICPPYDVISPAEKEELLAASGYNIVRVEFPENKPVGIKRAGKTFQSWRRDGVLIKDRRPSFYVYTQQFEISGRSRTRTGFFCALKLDPERIYRHEHTSAKPVDYRLELLKGVGANTSPIFCLFGDTQGRASDTLSAYMDKKSTKRLYQFTDKDNIKHSLRAVTDPLAIFEIQKTFTGEKFVIADGHHRYRTSLLYAEMKNRQAAGRDRAARPAHGAGATAGTICPHNYILAFLCPAESPGLVILPTHRAVRPRTDVSSKIKRYFDLKEWDGKGKPQIVVYHTGSFRIMHLKKKYLDKFRRYLQVPAIVLHKLVFDEVRTEDIYFTKDYQDAVRKAEEVRGYAFLLEPVKTGDLFLYSLSGMIMPPKTTYFYPKVPAGLVVYQV